MVVALLKGSTAVPRVATVDPLKAAMVDLLRVAGTVSKGLKAGMASSLGVMDDLLPALQARAAILPSRVVAILHSRVVVMDKHLHHHATKCGVRFSCRILRLEADTRW